MVDRDQHICTICNCPERRLIAISEEERNETRLLNTIKDQLEFYESGLHPKLAIPIERFPDNSSQLQVHHKYYILGYLPWEYKDECLQTVCENCHKEIHLKNNIPIYDSSLMNNIITSRTTCQRCNGIGFIPKYNHIENGICFNCRGNKFEEFNS
jgi:hypothetical protein